MMNSSRFFNLQSKTFSSIATVRFQKTAKNIKNYMLFLTEKDIENNSNPYIKFFNQTEPARIQDIKRQKFGIVYPFQPNVFFSERLCLVSSPESLDKVRTVASRAFKALAANKIDDVHVGFSTSMPVHHRRIILSSIIMSNYNFKITGEVKEEEEDDSLKTEKKESKKKDTIVKEIIVDLLGDQTNTVNQDSLGTWVNLANATLFTRNLANQRPNVADCDYLEEIARKIYNSHKEDNKVSIEVMKGQDLAKNGLNLIHAVGKSAESEPRVIILTYKGKPEDKNISHAIVGKGLTFDTGGLNLKPTNFIEDMYLDKHGACNTLSVFKSVVEMELPINVVCAIGAAENSIDGLSYKPSDIIKSHKGYTVEITNTDAEGRLVLADVLSYVQMKYKPQNIIDLATLTGACMVALGHRTAGLFTNNTALSSEIVKASEEVMEPVWHLPITNEHREDLKSPYADLKNAGKDRYGGASKGAAFLEKFINKGVNWVHLDIAG
jgi:leucyl aminopeptidase